MHIAAAQAGAAGVAGHGTAGRGRICDVAGRHEAYSHLKLMLLGA